MPDAATLRIILTDEGPPTAAAPAPLPAPTLPAGIPTSQVPTAKATGDPQPAPTIGGTVQPQRAPIGPTAPPPIRAPVARTSTVAAPAPIPAPVAKTSTVAEAETISRATGGIVRQILTASGLGAVSQKLAAASSALLASASILRAGRAIRAPRIASLPSPTAPRPIAVPFATATTARAVAPTATAAIAGGAGLAVASAGIVAGGALLVGASVAFTASVRKFGDITLRMGERLAKFSAPLAATVAKEEFRQIQRDRFEAQRLGPSIIRAIEARSQLEDKIIALMIPIKESLVKLTTNVIGFTDDAIEKVVVADIAAAKTITDLVNDLFVKWKRFRGEDREDLIAEFEARIEKALGIMDQQAKDRLKDLFGQIPGGVDPNLETLFTKVLVRKGVDVKGLFGSIGVEPSAQGGFGPSPPPGNAFPGP